MSKHNYIIAILGKSSAGKDSVARVLSNKYGYEYVVSTTTRKMRSNEKQDVDYHFVPEDEFQRLIDNNELVEYRYYDTIQDDKPARWHYGVERKEIDLDSHDYVCVVDLVGLADLKREYGSKVISVYIDVSESTRKTRAIARDRFFEEAEFARRCKDDDVKFKDVEKKVDIVVRNDNFDKCIEGVVQSINKIKNMRTFYTQYASY